MERQRLFTTDTPGHLRFFESDIPGDALGQLMKIMEDIHSSLYSPGAARSNTGTRDLQIQRLNTSLDTLAHAHAASIPPLTQDTADTDPMKMKLVYAFHVSQILVLRCDRRNPKAQEKMREIARASLKLVASAVSQPPHTATRLSLLASIIGDYPVVAFYELAFFHLDNLFGKGEHDATAQADMGLLRTVLDHLQVLEHDKPRNTIYVTLRLGLGWVLNVLQKVGETITGPPPTGVACQTASSTRISESPPSPSLPQLIEGCPLRIFRADPTRSNLLPPQQDKTNPRLTGDTRQTGVAASTQPLNLVCRPSPFEYLLSTSESLDSAL
ncbi:hypothetical protein AK830_g6026 [Neonectria ditissima]|uniref:Uncharacterized protein n=1 Tax=Neonectria ditissima TaxID=78410 RepID=A0A0P7BJS9_9HYPO|nr:hypothetical protein AK830_g6026 [Neonectria ditissima]